MTLVITENFNVNFCYKFFVTISNAVQSYCLSELRSTPPYFCNLFDQPLIDLHLLHARTFKQRYCAMSTLQIQN